MSTGKSWAGLEAILRARRIQDRKRETKRSLISLPMSATAPAPASMDPDPNVEKYQQWFGIGGMAFGFAAAAWAKIKCPSKEQVEKWVDDRIDHLELMKLLDHRRDPQGPASR